MSARTALLCLMAAVLLAGCQAGKNKSADENVVVEYSGWRYENFPGQNGGVIHAAVTAAKAANEADANRLFASAVSQNCENVVLSLTVNDTGKTFTADQVFRDLKGEMRIDGLAPHQIVYDYDTLKGKSRIFVNLGRIFDNEAIRKQVQNGQMVRFTLTMEKTARVFLFSLKNINNAMYALANNCKESSAFQDSAGKAPAQGRQTGTPPKAVPGAGGNEDDKQFFK